jgi:CheY-like chemotaxis protein
MTRSTADKRSVALIVEDNQVNRMVASQMLRRGDIDAVEAESAQAALDLLQSTSVDVVLMDVQMPGMDGLDAARAIRRGEAGEAARTTPIIAMTAYASKEDEEACYEAGMNAYLSKPLNMQAFIKTVQEIVDEYSPDTGSQR